MCLCFNYFLLFATLGSISLALNRLVEEEHVKALRSIPCQDAPILLEYTPSYRGILKTRKPKKNKEGETQAEPIQQPEPVKQSELVQQSKPFETSKQVPGLNIRKRSALKWLGGEPEELGDTPIPE